MTWWESALAGIVGGAGTIGIVELSKLGYRRSRRPYFILERRNGNSWYLNYTRKKNTFNRPTLMVAPLEGPAFDVQFMNTKEIGFDAPPESAIIVRWVDRGERQAECYIRANQDRIEFNPINLPKN